MKMIRTVALAAAMFAAVTTVAKAQGGGGGRGNRPNPTLTVLKDSLKVSDAVFAKADSIVKAYGAKNAELRASANGDMASVAPKMAELRTQQTSDIKALLTDEQKAAFDKIMAAMPQGRRGGPPPTR
jgi:protein CpxP